MLRGRVELRKGRPYMNGHILNCPCPRCRATLAAAVRFTDLTPDEQIACLFGHRIEHAGKMYTMVKESTQGSPSLWTVEPIADDRRRTIEEHGNLGEIL